MRQKPWEQAGSIAATDSILNGFPSSDYTTMDLDSGLVAGPTGSHNAATAAELSAESTQLAGAPPVPSRSSLADPGLVGPASAVPSQMGMLGGSAYGNAAGVGMGGVGSGYGGFGGYGGYSSYGAGGGYGSGYGSGYGAGYGGYGGSYGGGYNRFGGAGAGYMGGNQLQASTAATFQMIESIVGAFGGFAQMLESTYMATHSSFFAMISVAEQLGHLKESLGSVLGIFAVLRWGRALLRRLRGQSKPFGPITLAEFQKFKASAASASSHPTSPSIKPLLLFLAAVFGLPYLIGRFVRALNQQVISEQQHQQQQQGLDPSQLQFCRAMYEFVPENPAIELELKKGDLLAILSNADSSGNASQWWRVRTRDGRSGYVPATYVQLLPKQLPQITDAKPTKTIESI